MTFAIQTKPPKDSIASGYCQQLEKEEQEMARKQRLTKTKRLSPVDLKTGEMYFMSGYSSSSLFRTESGCLVEDWSEKCGSINWKEPFLVVAITRLHITKPGALRKYLIKVICSDKMGWLSAKEIHHKFKNLTPDALQEETVEPPAEPAYRGPTSWTLKPTP